MLSKTKTYLFFALLCFTAFSCKDKDCESERIGRIIPPQNYYNYTPHTDNEIVEYESLDGQILRFEIDTFIQHGRVTYDEIGMATHPQNGPYSCFEYKDTDWTYTQFREIGTDEYGLNMKIIALGETEETLEYTLEMFSSWIIREPSQITGGSNGRYNITKDEFAIYENSYTVAEKIASLDLNGKVFTDVFSFTNLDDLLYFVPGTGIVGFTGIDGVLFTLKQ